MRIIAKFEKREAARFVSHLDTQRVFQRAFRRADIPVAYTNGFNPRPVLSFAAALAVGVSSSAEWLDVRLESETSAGEFAERVNGALPRGYSVLSAAAADEKYPSLASVMAAAEYGAKLIFAGDACPANTRAALAELLSGPIMVMKTTKSGPKNTDIRPYIYRMEIEDIQGGACRIKLAGRLDSAGGLRAGLPFDAFRKALGEDFALFLHRTEIYSADGAYMPLSPYRGEPVAWEGLWARK